MGRRTGRDPETSQTDLETRLSLHMSIRNTQQPVELVKGGEEWVGWGRGLILDQSHDYMQMELYTRAGDFLHLLIVDKSGP